MSEPQHTPEPWGHIRGQILSPMADDPTTANVVADCGWEPQGLADARRIVAAVNACRGVKTDELESLEGKLLVAWAADLLKERDEARAMVKELAVVLDAVRATIESSEHWWMNDPGRGGFNLELIKSAVAKALS